MKFAPRKLGILLAAVFGLGAAVFSPTSQAAPAEPSVVTSQAVKGSAVLKIKVKREDVNKGAASAKPRSKSARGAGDYIHVDNHTPLVIDIYADGYYDGTVGAYGDLYLRDRTGGANLLSAAAPGTRLHWGPRMVMSPHTWRLYY